MYYIDKKDFKDLKKINFTCTKRVPSFLFSNDEGIIDKEKMRSYIKYHQQESNEPLESPSHTHIHSMSHSHSKKRFLSPSTSRAKITKLGELSLNQLFKSY